MKVIALALAAFSTCASAQSVSPLISITPAEFLKLPDGAKALYVGGVLDGMTFTTYGYGIPDHDKFAKCVRTLTLGALAQRTADWLRANPSHERGYGLRCCSDDGAVLQGEGVTLNCRLPVGSPPQPALP